MEKLTYILWRDAQEAAGGFNTRLLRELSAELLALGAARLSINVVDDAVAPGAHLRQENTRPAPAALVSFWLNSAHVRAPLEAAVQRIDGAAQCRDRAGRGSDAGILAGGADHQAAAPDL